MGNKFGFLTVNIVLLILCATKINAQGLLDFGI